MSEDVTPYSAAGPHCRQVHTLERNGEFSVEYQCSHCRGWARVVVSGPYRELTVDKGATPADDVPIYGSSGAKPMTDDEPKETQELLDPEAGDIFLKYLVSLANAAMEIPITLQVGGMLVSGVTISYKRYFNASAADFADRLNGAPELAEAIKGNISMFGESAEDSRDDGFTRLKFIHLRDAQYLASDRPPIVEGAGIMWRGRISQVSGFHLGALVVKRSG